MLSRILRKNVSFLILLVLFTTACSQALGTTQSPTTVSTETPTPNIQKPQVTIFTSQVVVEQITLLDPDPDTGEMEALVMGHTSNTCTAVDRVTVSRDGEVFYVQVETKNQISANCQQKAVQFEELAIVDIQDLEPGVYLVASGVVQTFEVGSLQPLESVLTVESKEDEVASDGAASRVDSSGTSTPTSDRVTLPISDEPRGCQDRAVFVADITFPDNAVVKAGEVFTKTWEIRNDGTCTWGPGYELEFVQGTLDQSVSLDEAFPVTAPKESVKLSVVVTAPRTDGTHIGTWVINRPEGDTIQTQAGQNFDFWAIVVVPSGRSAATATGSRETNADGVVCSQENSTYVTQLLQLINDARAVNGLPAYELQNQLTNAAKALTTDMACNDFVSHTGTDGSGWYERITAQGYVYDDAGENIVFGYGTVPQLAMNWWMGSSVHRGNILSKNYSQIGIAYRLNPQTGGSYYTLVFASPSG